MDTVKYSQEIYLEHKKRVILYLTKVIGFKKEGIDFIPTVATDGDNLFPIEAQVKKKKNLKYHKGLLVSNENMLWWRENNGADGADVDGRAKGKEGQKGQHEEEEKEVKEGPVGQTLIQMIDNFVQPPTSSMTNLPIITYSTERTTDLTLAMMDEDVAEEEEEEEEEEIEEEEEEEEKEKEEEGEKGEDGEKGEKNEENDDDDDDKAEHNSDKEKTNKKNKRNQLRKKKPSKSFWQAKPITRRGTALRMPVSKVYQIPGVGTVAVGKIVSGSIAQYEEIRIVPGPLDYMNVLKDDDYDTKIQVPEEETESELEARLALGEVGHVKSIQMWKKSIPKRGHVRVGDYCGIRIQAANKNIKKYLIKDRKTKRPLVKPGSVLGSCGLDQFPLRTVKEFCATIVFYNLPRGNVNNETSLGVTVGYAPLIDVHTAHVQCRIVDIIKKRARGKDDRIPPANDPFVDIDRKNDSRASRRNKSRGKSRGRTTESKDKLRNEKEIEELKHQKIMMKTGDCCDVRMVPFRPLVVEPFDVCPALARFVVRDSGRVVGSGIVQSVKYGMHHGSEFNIGLFQAFLLLLRCAQV